MKDPAVCRSNFESAIHWSKQAINDVDESLEVRAYIHALSALEAVVQAVHAAGVPRRDVLERVAAALPPEQDDSDLDAPTGEIPDAEVGP